MKKLSIITAAIFLGLSGIAMAGDSGENHGDYSNTRGFNPYMPEFSAPAAGYSARAEYSVPHQAAHRHVEK
jgi:hypothetical protein